MSYLIYILIAFIAWVGLYFVIKTAVKNGIIEARRINDHSSNIEINKTGTSVNQEQLKLQKKYESNEISFEEYQSEWKKLNS